MAGTFSFLRTAALGLLGLTLVGCVSSDQYNALKLEKDRMAEQLVQAQGDANSNRAAAKAYKDQLDSLGASGNTQAALMSNLTSQNASLQAQLDDLNKRYAEAMNRPMTAASPLPEKLNNALAEFAQQNPDLIDFDSARGVVKFKSDVTFDVGDATVTPKAKDVIDRFAKILNSSVASQYELLIAGHTDNQPVHNPATIAKGHKDNWYLSSHRAISVSTELQKNGVNGVRIGVVGYADERPIAPNTSASGQLQNRRVEVIILPTAVHNAPPTVATGPKMGNAKPAAAKVTKDSPSINK